MNIRRIALMVVVMMSGVGMVAHNKGIGVWGKVQSTLLLSVDEMVEIRNKIGTISSQKLKHFREAIDHLLVQKVVPSKPFSCDALQAAPEHHKRIYDY